ncbi:MAG: FG-GAP repeat protein, partial [Phycisphaerales bacterium]
MPRKYLLAMSLSIIGFLCLFSKAQAFVGAILEFQAPNPSNGDKYGRAVSIDRDTAVICADDAGGGDYLYVYRFNGLDWQYETTLTVPYTETSLRLGETDRVCIVGDTIVAGSPGYGSNKGAVYVFERNGTQWRDPNILTASDGNNGDLFGWAVAYDGTKIIAGSPLNDDYRGAAYVFSWNGTSWDEEQKLVASDGESRTERGYPSPAAYGDRLGMAVAIDADTIVIGAQWDQCDCANNMFAGSAYVFGYDGNTWTEQDKLENP